MNIIVMYLLISLGVAINDLWRLSQQERELASFPSGDIDYYIKPKVFGLHNWIFLPSWIVIGLVLSVTTLINRLF